MFPNGLRGFFVIDTRGRIKGLVGSGGDDDETTHQDHVPVTMGTEPLTFLSDGFGNLLVVEYSE